MLRMYKKATGLRSVIDRVLLHSVWGYLIFFSILLLIFQVIFDWSSIPMDFIDSTFVSLSQSVKSGLPQGVFTSLLAEGSNSRFSRNFNFCSTDCIIIFLYFNSRRNRIHE